MQKAVEDYLAKVRAEEDTRLADMKVKAERDETEYRNKVLKAAGLIRKEYTAGGEKFDSQARLNYTEIPVEITDEEWEAIKAAYEKQHAGDRDKAAEGQGAATGNGVASILKTFAIIIYIGGLIAGIVLGRDLRGDFSLLAALPYWIAFFVGGAMMHGFAEIVRLLQVIADK